MGARGRRGLIVGLEDLARGIVLSTEMKRRAAADALERERFEYEKQLRDAQLAEEGAYHTGLLSARKSEMSAKAREASEKQRAKLLEGIQRGRVSKNLESGNLTRAARIAFNRGIALPEHMTKLFAPDEPAKLTGIAAEAAGAGMSPLDYRKAIAAASRSAEPSAIDRYKETEALAAEIGGVPAIPYNMGKASRFVTGADNLPLPKPVVQEESDPYAAMEQSDWDGEVFSILHSLAGEDTDLLDAIASSPRAIALKHLPPDQRLKEILKIKDATYFVGNR